MRNFRVNWHHRLLCEKVQAWDEGIGSPLLMVFQPPRSGKSEIVSRRLPAWIHGRRPDTQFMACSYAATLAGRMCRDVQRIITSPSYRRLFPHIHLGYDPQTATKAARTGDHFEIAGRAGSYRCAGVGGSITGMGFDRAVIDDPIKSAAEARSPTHREGVWEWFRSDFWTRRQEDARILLTLTRWHHDDLAGRLIRLAEEGGEKWDIVCLPAEAYADDDPLRHPDDPRPERGPLWPEHKLFTAEALASSRVQMGPFAYESLMQQRPTPKEGGLFTLESLSHVVPHAPAEAMVRVRAWDKGYSAEGDYTVGVLMSRTVEGLFFIEDVVRLRCDPHTRNATIKATAEADDAKYGRRIKQLIERPPGAGSETTAALVRHLAGHAVLPIRPVGDKSERAEPFSAQCLAGNVRLVSGAWNRAYVDELILFPGGDNDDQVDASSTAFNDLTNKVVPKVFMV